MRYKFPAVYVVLVVLLFSCRNKHLPQTAAKPTIIYNGKPVPAANEVATPVATSTVVKKAVVKKVSAPLAKVIIVNDKAAKKNIDGRLYYDVEGHRYWKNYNDGKYYIFNKAMYSDSAFIPH